MSDDFVPGNDLEEALVRAATDPAARSEFYRRVIEGELLFLTPDPPGGNRAPSAGSMVNLLSWEGPGGSFVPCFSSPARVREVVEKMGDPGSYLALPGRSAFQMLAQIPAEAFLNPGLGYGKRFVPKEIRKIADGTIFQAFTEGPAAPPRALTNPRTSQEFSTDLLDESTSPSFRTDRADPYLDVDVEPPTPPAETVRPPMPERSRPATPVPAAYRAPVAAASSSLPSNLPPWPEPAARPMAGSMPAAAAAPTGSSRLRLKVPLEDQVTPPPSPSSPSISSSGMPVAGAGRHGNGTGATARGEDEAPTDGPVQEPPRRKPWWKFW